MSRREVLTPGRQRQYFVSSAIVVAMPDRIAEVAQAIASLGGAEINAQENHRIVVVLEGPSGDALADLLRRIGDLDGVVAANMVFEQVEELGSTEA